MPETAPPETLIPALDEAFDLLERRDLDGFMETVNEMAHPELEFHSGIGSAVGGGVYKGPDGVRTWFADLLASAEKVRWRERSYETFGKRVMALLARLELVGSASGVSIDGETAAVFQFDGGLCVRIDSFLSHSEGRAFAREAVGA